MKPISATLIRTQASAAELIEMIMSHDRADFPLSDDSFHIMEDMRLGDIIGLRFEYQELGSSRISRIFVDGGNIYANNMKGRIMNWLQLAGIAFSHDDVELLTPIITTVLLKQEV